MEQVHIDSITKSFDGKPIISGGSMHLKTGDITGVFGRNGAGKSTLFSILSLKSNSHYTTVNLPLPNQEEITVAFNDLGIENPYLKNFVFNYSTTMEKEDFYNSDGIDDLISAMEKENIIYNSNDIEVQPSYPGGIDEFRKFVARNYKGPKNIGRSLMGQVLVQFVVEKDGSLSDIKVLRDLGYGTGAEAVRVLKISKKWNPGILNGKPVPVKYVWPITINIKD